MTAPAKPTPTREEAEAAVDALSLWPPEHDADELEQYVATIRAALALLPTQEEMRLMQVTVDRIESGKPHAGYLRAYLDRLRGTVQS